VPSRSDILAEKEERAFEQREIDRILRGGMPEGQLPLAPEREHDSAIASFGSLGWHCQFPGLLLGAAPLKFYAAAFHINRKIAANFLYNGPAR
jgi:hypothetical protein